MRSNVDKVAQVGYTDANLVAAATAGINGGHKRMRRPMPFPHLYNEGKRTNITGALFAEPMLQQHMYSLN